MAAAPQPTVPAVYLTSPPPGGSLYPGQGYQYQSQAVITLQGNPTQQPPAPKTSKCWNARNAAIVDIVISAILIALICTVYELMDIPIIGINDADRFLVHGLPLVILHCLGFGPPITYLVLSLKEPKNRDTLMYWTCMVWVVLGTIRRTYELLQCLVLLLILAAASALTSGTLETGQKYFYIFHPIVVAIVFTVYIVMCVIICRDIEIWRKAIRKAEAEANPPAVNLENAGYQYNYGFQASPAVVTTQDAQNYQPAITT